MPRDVSLSDSKCWNGGQKLISPEYFSRALQRPQKKAWQEGELWQGQLDGPLEADDHVVDDGEVVVVLQWDYLSN